MQPLAAHPALSFMLGFCWCADWCVSPALLQLKELKTELGGLRVAKVTGGAPNKLSKM
jgi:hypothetical protein